MVRNRSVPSDTLLPHIFYQNLTEAIIWLIETFGFSEHYRYGDPVNGAQLYLGGAFIMVSKPRDGTNPARQGLRGQYLTVFVDDVDAHFARTQAHGAKIVEELQETIYGERQYGVEDIEGHRWLFSRHIRDVSPAEWGAVLAGNPAK